MAGSNRSREASEGQIQTGRRYTEGEGTGTDKQAETDENTTTITRTVGIGSCGIKA